MSLEMYFAYVLATAVVLVVPGPTVMLVVSYGLAQGRRAAWPAVLGVGLGDFTDMVLSLAGLGAVLAASDSLFHALKWAGAAYLVYLGVKMWRSNPDVGHVAGRLNNCSSRRTFLHVWAVTATNPKGIAFFVAFLPQFINPAAPALPQIFLLGGTFLVMAIMNAAGYSLLAGRVRDTLKRPGLPRLVSRIGGSVLVGAGVMTAASSRS